MPGVEAALAAARLGAQRCCCHRRSRSGSARSPAIRRSAAAPRDSSCARSTRSAARWARIADATQLHARFLNEIEGPVGARAARAGRQTRYMRAPRDRGAAARNRTCDRAGHGRRSDRRRRARFAACSHRRRRYVARRRVVLATGTFLGGKTFRGDEVRPRAASAKRRRSGSPTRWRALGFPDAAAQDRDAAADRPHDASTSRAMARTAAERRAAAFSYRSRERVRRTAALRATSTKRTQRTHASCARTSRARRSTAST